MTARTRKHKLIISGIIILLVGLVAGYVVFEQLSLLDSSQDAPQKQVTGVAFRDMQTASQDRSKESLDSYKVGSEFPRILTIESLGVTARVLPMKLTAQNSIEAPFDINDAGWYEKSAKPNEDGVAFIDGHASGATRMGVFAYLDTMKAGNTIAIELGSGQTIRYEVRTVEITPLKEVDMARVLTANNAEEKELRLMACTGAWLPNEKTYDHRVVVYAKQVSS